MGLSNSERQARYRERKRQLEREVQQLHAQLHEPAPADAGQHIAQLKARVAELEAKIKETNKRAEETTDAFVERNVRIAELEAALASSKAAPAHRAAAVEPKQRRPESRRTAVEEGKASLLHKLIRRLDAPENDNEAAIALRALASELQVRGKGFQELADLTTQWDAEDRAVRPPKRKPIDWPEVERAIKTYTEGKTKVTMNKVMRAVYAQVPALNLKLDDPSDWGMSVNIAQFFHGCLHRLGFKNRPGRETWEREAAKQK
jgi:hypothetical protein